MEPEPSQQAIQHIVYGDVDAHRVVLFGDPIMPNLPAKIIPTKIC